MSAAPMPCTARAMSSTTMVPDSAQTSEEAVKMAMPQAKTRRRPMRSASEPALSTMVAKVRV